MKKKYLAVILVTAFLFAIIFYKRVDAKDTSDEVRGIFISYIEFMKYFDNKDESEITQIIKEMVDNVSNNYFNTIYLQVRPFSDSIYESSLFPFSKTIASGNVDIDVLSLFFRFCA